MQRHDFEPKKCWVGDQQKICYDSEDEAEVAARVAEYDHRWADCL